MVEKAKVLKGAMEIARTLGYVAKAKEKMEQGMKGEAYANLTQGVHNAIKNWDLISYPFEVLWNALTPQSLSTVQAALAESTAVRSGFFTGRWASQPGRIELMYHDKDTNTLSLFFQKAGVSVFAPDSERLQRVQGCN